MDRRKNREMRNAAPKEGGARKKKGDFAGTGV
jgi:hypothetical protein